MGTVREDMVAQNLDILVCDDEPPLREALRQSFEREGHRVMAVPDGRSAIDRASTQQFDVAAARHRARPGSPDGYEVCRTLRERRNNVPIIMLTALDSEADAVLGPGGRRRRLRRQAVPARPSCAAASARVLRRVGAGARAEARAERRAADARPGPRARSGATASPSR